MKQAENLSAADEDDNLNHCHCTAANNARVTLSETIFYRYFWNKIDRQFECFYDIPKYCLM